MKQEGLKFFTDTYLTSLGLVIFFVFFVCMTIWVFKASNRSRYEYLENLPLDQGGQHEPR